MHIKTPSSGPADASARRRRSPRQLAAVGVLALSAVALTALPAGAQSGGTVNLVAYSTPKPAYTVLATDFAKTKAGAGVTVSPSFGPSGTQATSVVDGLPADVVNFSLEPDMDKLVKAGLVSSSWDKGPTKGMVTDSIVSFIVRPGNPKHITTWADLVKPGVGVITPNVFSSGSAKWNIMAAYGAEIEQGKTPAQAQTYLSELLHNAVAQPSSASAALQTFLSGQGDVLLDYEDDALYAKTQGEPVDVDHAAADDPDPEPDRGDQDGQPGRQGLPGLPALPCRPDRVGPAGLPPRPAVGGGQVQVPQAQDALHHRQPRRLDRR